jgi:hypothetical protein
MKLKPKDIKRYNKIADKGRKPIMVRVGHKWYTWYEGDPKHGVFLTTQSGRDVEFDFKQIDDIQEGVEKLTISKLKEMVGEVMNERKKKVPIEKLSVGNTYTDSKGYPVKIVDISGGGNSWKITYKDGYGKKKIIKTSLSKGVNLYESIDEGLPTKVNSKYKKLKMDPESEAGKDFLAHHSGDNTGVGAEPDTYDFDDDQENEPGVQAKHKDKKRGYEPVREGMFTDYHELKRPHIDKFIKNYKKLNSKNVVKKKGDDVYGFRKGEREAHWKYDTDSLRLNYDINKTKALGLINFFNRAKKNHPWG